MDMVYGNQCTHIHINKSVWLSFIIRYVRIVHDASMSEFNDIDFNQKLRNKLSAMKIIHIERPLSLHFAHDV